MATNADSPSVLGSLQQLQKEAKEATPEPARFMTSAGRITFPDPGVMEAFESDELLSFVVSPATDTKAVLKKWLSPEDFEKVAAEKLTRRAMTALLKKVQSHYNDIFGGPGESSASPS